MRAKKSLGQHFLTDEGTALAVVRWAHIEPGTQVLEIGPGRGFLTRYLLRAGAHVTAVEKDDRLARELGDGFPEAPLQVVCADFLDLSLDEIGPECRVLVGNLPYNVSLPLLLRALEHAERWTHLVFMFQLEVARRLTAEPGGKSFGVPSAVVALTHHCRIVRRVPPGAFRPRPAVESALVAFEPRAEPLLPPEARRAFADWLGAAFRYRRKKACNALAQATGESSDHFRRGLLLLGVSPSVRLEKLSMAHLVALWDWCRAR